MDVVIPTKNRYEHLARAVNQARAKLPCGNLIVVDSSEKPDKQFLLSLPFDFVLFTPNAFLGYARQKGLECASSEFVVFLDDDIEVGHEWFKEMMKCFKERVVAVSSQVVFYDLAFPALQKLCESGRSAGASGGSLIVDRKKVLACGGWHSNIHFAEDYELFVRLKKYGFKWKRTVDAKAYHRSTYTEWMDRAFRNGHAITRLAQVGTTSKLFLFIRTFASSIVMPFYYLAKTRDVEVFKIYARFKLNFLFGCLRGLQNDSRSWRR